MTQKYMEEMSIPKPREQPDTSPNGSIAATPILGG